MTYGTVRKKSKGSDSGIKGKTRISHIGFHWVLSITVQDQVKKSWSVPRIFILLLLLSLTKNSFGNTI